MRRKRTTKTKRREMRKEKRGGKKKRKKEEQGGENIWYAMCLSPDARLQILSQQQPEATMVGEMVKVQRLHLLVLM
jgi:hypothetical protein